MKGVFVDKIRLAKPLFDVSAAQLEVTAEVASAREILD